MVADNCVSGLFRVQLETIGDLNTNAAGFEELGDLGVVGEVRTGGVAPRVAATTVLLAE